MPRPILLITLGAPGSGKTYFSERISKEKNFFHLSGDQLRLKIFKKPDYSRKESDVVYGFADFLAEELLEKRVSVIYDANFNFKKSRDNARKIAKKAGARCYVISIETNEKVALKRLIKRGKTANTRKKELYRPIDERIYYTFKNEIESPTKNEKVIHIDGHKNFKEQLKEFTTQFKGF